MPKIRDKYALYEEAVQTPDAHAHTFALIHAELKGRHARVLREDFCGTFRISCEWVKAAPKNRAIALDIDSEPLAYGHKHLSHLTAAQKRRLDVREKSVLNVTSPKAGVVAACNFSFYVLKTRAKLLRYFRAVHASLKAGGILILEMSGGPDMITEGRERRNVNEPHTGKYTYVWDQKSFDPITHAAHYAIHFKFPGGKTLNDAFTYDWRLWTIPEVRDALAEAGFRKSHVYWETTHRGRGTGQYARMENGDNAYSWIAYVVGEQ